MSARLLGAGTHPLPDRPVFVADGRGADQALPVLVARGVPESRAALVASGVETGRGPGGLHGRAILRMDGGEPAVSGVLVPGLPGVVLPGVLQLRECAVAARLPRHVGEQL